MLAERGVRGTSSARARMDVACDIPGRHARGGSGSPPTAGGDRRCPGDVAANAHRHPSVRWRIVRAMRHSRPGLATKDDIRGIHRFLCILLAVELAVLAIVAMRLALSRLPRLFGPAPARRHPRRRSAPPPSSIPPGPPPCRRAGDRGTETTPPRAAFRIVLNLRAALALMLRGSPSAGKPRLEPLIISARPPAHRW